MPFSLYMAQSAGLRAHDWGSLRFCFWKRSWSYIEFLCSWENLIIYWLFEYFRDICDLMSKNENENSSWLTSLDSCRTSLGPFAGSIRWGKRVWNFITKYKIAMTCRAVEVGSMLLMIKHTKKGGRRFTCTVSEANLFLCPIAKLVL